MRVGSLQMTTRYMTQLNRSYDSQSKLLEQGDGAKLHRPSDNAIGYSKYLRFSSSYGENDQYQYNIKTAVSWMKNTDAALVDMSDAMKTVVEKANQAQGTNTNVDMKAIADEMMVRVQQCVSDANNQVNGRYLFAGQTDLVQPYTMTTEKLFRGLTKTLDDKQADFFNDVSKSGETAMAQMLVLEGGDGDTYYLNTKTGAIYTKEFVDEGYKSKVVNGQKHVVPSDNTVVPPVLGDAVAVLANSDFKVSSYFEPTGVARFKASVTVTEGGTTTTKDRNFGEEIVGNGQTITADADLAVLDDTGKYLRTIPAGKTDILAAGEKAYIGGKTIEDASGTGTATYERENPSTGKKENVPYTLTVYDNDGNPYVFSNVQQYIVAYLGDTKEFSMVKENGAVQPASDTVNASGADLGGCSIFDNEYSGNVCSCANIFNDLLTVVAMCERDDSNWMSSDSKTLATNSFNTVNVLQSRIAARQQVYADCEEMLATQSETILEDITNVYATDVAKLAVDLMTAQTLYNLSLSFGSRVIPPTLADYL